MAKKAAKMTDTLELVKPYLERALTDEEFRNDLKDALGAARELYGPLAKQNGVSGSARALATDKKAQEQMRRAIEDLMSAKDTLQGKKEEEPQGPEHGAARRRSSRARSTTPGPARRRARSCST